MSLSVIPNLINVTLPANVLSPVLSIVIILSVIPVLLSEDTLPDIKIRSRKQKKHLEELEKLLEESKE